jgi:Holliday junction resolvase-like predicted endonuclease
MDRDTGSPRSARRTARRVAGDLAEEAVASLLSSLGWTILARNVRVGRSEVDIVGLDPGPPPALAFVEVRSGSVGRFGAPEESVDAAKVGRLYRAAWRLVREGSLPDGRRLPREAWRVDLVAVVLDDGSGHWIVTRHLRGIQPP